ncbi:MAG: MFS transporter [Blastocatellia bacterium]
MAGVFVDRWNVKRTMITSDLIRAVLALLLVASTSLNQVYLILFLLSLVSTFFVPAQTVTLRTIVPREGLMAANALMQQAFQLVRIASPAVAGLLVKLMGPDICYYLDSLSFVISASLVATLLVKRETSGAVKANSVQSVLSDLTAGIKFVVTHPVISFVLLAMAAGMFAISCFGPLIAIYLRDVLKTNELVFGIINSLIGVGMIAGTLGLNKLAQNRSKNHLPLFGLFTMGAFVFVMALFNNLTMTAVAMLGVGVGAVLIFVSAQTMMQGHTPMEMMGRVSSSVMAVISISQLVGLLFSGSLAQSIGIRPMFYVSAIFLALIAGVGYFFLPHNAPGKAGATT